MANLQNIYRNKGFDGSVDKPLVIKTGTELIKPVDREFGIGIDYDSPDYAMREALKRNIWKFSVAKNYSDNARLNNLLLRPGGSLRPWNEFKREAMFVVGESNRYLKTEYDTIVAGAQMSRLWQEIQRDKHIFPYVQLKVVMDGHTSEICSPLHDLIFEVDDPVLAYYFPPNHFNCRTTAIKLRDGKPSKNFTLPKIPEDFQNNVGMCPDGYKQLLALGDENPPKRKACGEIFTEKNAYISNTPEEELAKAEEIAQRFEKYQQLLQDENYYDVEFGSNAGLKATHKEHLFDKKLGYLENEAHQILYDNGFESILESEKGFETKHVEGTINNLKNEIKTITGNSPATIAKRIQQSIGKGADVCTLYFPNKNSYLLERALQIYKGKLPFLIVIDGKKIIRTDIDPF